MSYDPLGRLQQTDASGVVTQFLYDGDRLVAEYDGAGALLRRYVHGAGVDEPIVWYEGATTADPRWLIADAQGSVIAAVNASGAVLSGTRYRYGPFGEPSAWAGSRFRYTGQIALREIQLYHYKARVYDPLLGRFLQTDPVGYEEDMNLYAYVRNDPLNRTDPTGRRDKPCDEACQGRVSASRAASGSPPPPPPRENQPVNVKPGVPPPSPAVGGMLQCTANCTGSPLRVTETSANHPAGNPHSRGLAADVTTPEPERVMQCAASCGATYQQNEYSHPSPNSTGGHVHLQMVPGRGGATGPYHAPEGGGQGEDYGWGRPN